MPTPDLICFLLTDSLYCVMPQSDAALAWAMANAMDQGKDSDPIRFINFKASMDTDLASMRSAGYTALVVEKPDWLEVEEADDG